MKKSWMAVPVLLASLVLPTGLAAAPPDRTAGERRIEIPSGTERMSQVWLMNLGDRTTEVAVAEVRDGATASPRLSIAAGKWADGSDLVLGSARLTVARDTELLTVASSRDLDPARMRFELHPSPRLVQTKAGLMAQVAYSDWAQDLQALRGTEAAELKSGQEVRVDVAPARSSSSRRLAVALLKADSAVKVMLRDNQGRELRSYLVSSTVPVHWQVDLDRAEDFATSQVEIRVERGTALGVVTTLGADGGKTGLQPIFMTSGSGGTAYYSTYISYSFSGPLYYYVVGGPANTCGEIDTYRNGGWQFTSNWVCTDASGNATKGPWYWSSTPSDQTDDPTFIRWPNGTATSSSSHIWDKTCSFIARDSPAGAPPTSYYGHATDGPWGAGVQQIYSLFQDTTTGLYWSTVSGDYTSSSYSPYVYGSLSATSVPSATWSTVFPPSGVHHAGHSYNWVTCVTDNGCGYCTNMTFTK